MAQEPWDEFFKEHPAPIYNYWSAAVTEKYHQWLVAHGWHKDEASNALGPIYREMVNEFFVRYPIWKQYIEIEEGKGCDVTPVIAGWLEHYHRWLKEKGLLKGDV